MVNENRMAFAKIWELAFAVAFELQFSQFWQ